MWKSLRTVLLLLPAIELLLLILLGLLIGGWATLAYVLGTGVLGYVLLSLSRRAGRGPRHGALPLFLSGGALPVSGLLLMLPGVLSTLLALALLVPGVRRAMLRALQRAAVRDLQRRMGVDLEGGAGFPGVSGAAPGPAPGAEPPLVVEAEVTEIREDA